MIIQQAVHVDGMQLAWDREKWMVLSGHKRLGISSIAEALLSSQKSSAPWAYSVSVSVTLPAPFAVTSSLSFFL